MLFVKSWNLSLVFLRKFSRELLLHKHLQLTALCNRRCFGFQGHRGILPVFQSEVPKWDFWRIWLFLKFRHRWQAQPKKYILWILNLNYWQKHGLGSHWRIISWSLLKFSLSSIDLSLRPPYICTRELSLWDRPVATDGNRSRMLFPILLSSCRHHHFDNYQTGFLFQHKLQELPHNAAAA